MRATVRDVARHAQVSPKTVSNVVNGTFPVSPETRQRVEDALRELDYVPNLSARGLRNGRTGVIAVALPDLSTPYSASITRAFVQAGARRGLTVQIEESAGSVEREAQLLSRARSHLIDGLVLNPVLLETSAVQPGVSLPPVVMIGEVEQPAVDHLWTDNVRALRELTGLLVDEGHRRIALLGGMPSASYQLRRQGYREALTAAGLPLDPALEIDVHGWTSAGGAEAVRSHLAHHPLPDALVCCTDTLAMGVLSALWADGYRVPDDLSVVGYDDIPEAAYTVPPLTTVHFDRQVVAEMALDLLARRINDPSHPSSSTVLPHRIVRRASTRPR
ncbi:DNA-binding transcriptional regulator, LacI/PurR family [Friedmanniella luteola]|uniref:DNA-binding transcriptional regulator, LacI/PurR family n=1 Tax=Friedmanniella luteola TaxID=546871 RepID=A0A1H1PVV0_9ACTN|nr:LacI family DNA-binding transcriptional regulator [Friedmanniella luteola]SDS15322.1 DNA-binding transcriptional regulator, LacI/PurR family [Friedmanniella luteola]